MIKVICHSCDNELDKPGALLFSPPRNGECLKYHICEECFKGLLIGLMELNYRDRA